MSPSESSPVRTRRFGRIYTANKIKLPTNYKEKADTYRHGEEIQAANEWSKEAMHRKQLEGGACTPGAAISCWVGRKQPTPKDNG